MLLAIKQYITAYNLTVNASGNSLASLASATYTDETASTTYGAVGSQAGNQIPTGAAGVRVVVQEPWTPFVLGVLGFSAFTITATATAVSAAQPNADTVFVNCPPYTGSNATVNLILSGGGGGHPDTITGNIFVNGSAKASGGTINVTGTFGTSGTLQGSGLTASGGVSQNQPPQQFPLPDVTYPLNTSGNPNTSIYNAGSGVPAYTPPGNYPEFDQEAYWDFYLGYNTNSLPGQGSAGNTPLYSNSYSNGDAVDMWFVVNKTPNLLNNVDLSGILAQIPDVTQTSYFPAYQGHYNNYFWQWVKNVYGNPLTDPTPALTYPWLHWVDMAGATASDPTTWYTLSPSVSAGILGFTAQKTTHPVNTFGGGSQCPYSRGCFPSGIWWAINWPAGSGPSIDMSSLGVAWTNPANGTTVSDAGITFMTNVEFHYQSSASASIYAWGEATTASKHPVEKNVYYYGWGTLGSLYVPRTVLYTTFAAPLPTDCSSTPPPEGLHLDGSGQSINGFVLVPYGGITFHGSGANNFNGELLAAQVGFSGSGVTLTYDTSSAVKGDPGLIQ